MTATLSNGAAPGPARIAVLDSDSGFVQVLTKRLEAGGWQYRVLASPVPLDALVSMRLNAIVVDPAVLGHAAWSYLEKLRAAAPVRCRRVHRPVDRGPAGPRPAPRR